MPVPDPVPDAVVVIHGTEADAVHAHDVCVVTVTALVAPAGAMMTRDGVTENVHDALG